MVFVFGPKMTSFACGGIEKGLVFVKMIGIDLAFSVEIDPPVFRVDGRKRLRFYVRAGNDLLFR